MTQQFYVLTGSNPEEWCECQPLGPYESPEKARQGLFNYLKESLDNCDGVPVGKTINWFGEFTMIAVVQSIQPSLKVTAKIVLEKS